MPLCRTRPNSSKRQASAAELRASLEIAPHRRAACTNLQGHAPCCATFVVSCPEARRRMRSPSDAGVGPQATGRSLAFSAVALQRRVPGETGDLGCPFEVGLALAGTAELEASTCRSRVYAWARFGRSPVPSSAAISRASGARFRRSPPDRLVSKRVEREASSGLETLVCRLARAPSIAGRRASLRPLELTATYERSASSGRASSASGPRRRAGRSRAAGGPPQPGRAPDRATRPAARSLAAARDAELRSARRPELLRKPIRLLEVVAEDLVELEGRPGSRVLEPLREALVELRAQLLRHRHVGRVPDKEMAETKRLLAREERPLGANQFLADERERCRSSSVRSRVRRSSPTAPRWNTSPSTAAALDDDPHVAVERVDPRLQERVDRRGTAMLAVAVLADHREHLLDVERVARRRGGDPLAQVAVELAHRRARVVDQRLALVFAERLEQERRRVELAAAPVGSRVEELGPRDAEEEDRRVARQVGDVLDEIDEHRLRPLQVVDDDDLRPLGRARLEQPAEREPASPSGRRDDGLRLDAERDQDLDERPVRDPLAVREAAAAQDVCRVADAFEEVGDEARLADAGRAEEREEPARAARRRRPRSRARGAGARARVRRAAPPDGGRAALLARAPRGAGGLDRLGFPFSASGSTASTRTASRTSARVSAPMNDLARRRGLLEPRGDVDRVAGDERLALSADDDLAGVDADPCLEPVLRDRARASPTRARTARSASSSCETGMPKTAMTASPTNFSTVPPWRSRMTRRSSK